MKPADKTTKHPAFTIFGRRTDMRYAYDLKHFDTLPQAVAWKNDFLFGRVLSPQGNPHRDGDTLHILNNARECEVDETGKQVVYNDWRTGKPIVRQV